MNLAEIRKYWEDRADSDPTVQSTTNDVFLREIEARVLGEQIEKFRPRAVVDIGCGDARTTARLAQKFKDIEFTGSDYAHSMIENSLQTVTSFGLSNVNLFIHDITTPISLKEMDFAYTTRCLINLPSWDLQKKALENIWQSLRGGGLYIMIENFCDDQKKFNELRRKFDLPEISIRSHNLFFENRKTIDFLSNTFEIVENTNISSSYYIMSRVIYSAICKERGESPDYFDKHHELAAQLPFLGDYGPVRMLCLRKIGLR
jgi:SAM-dependent methyltransferase